MQIELKIDERKITLMFEKVVERMRVGLFEATKEAGQSITRHIRDDLLNGEILNDTTGFPRADRTTSLAQGALRKAIYSVPSASGNEARVTIGIRGSDQLKFIANLLNNGSISHEWDIPNPQSPFSQATGGRLHILFRDGGEAIVRKVTHHGIEASHFMQIGLQNGKDYFITLAQRALKKAVKNG